MVYLQPESGIAARLRYSYITRISFSEKIHRHHFLLRCMPAMSSVQQTIESYFSISPECSYTQSTDWFGNTIITGSIEGFHDYFEFKSEGVVQTFKYRISEALNRLFLYPSQYTQPMLSIRQLADELHFSENLNAHQRVAAISDLVNSRLQYITGSTGIETTAAAALELGAGVCQDFAQLAIALCRLSGVAARYVSGFMEGEGFTHAWLEYYCKGSWYGYDPTHNRLIENGYIKIAHGRDYADCAVDKGVFRGLAQQKLEVYLKAEPDLLGGSFNQ